MEQQAKGAQFLKVTGIIMIVGGALGIILGIVALIAAIAANALAGGALGLLIVAALLALVGSVIQLIAGIIGVKNCNKPEKAQTCIVWGAIVVAFSVLSTILTVVAGGEFDIVSFLIGLVLPGLFIFGAIKNKQA